MFFDRQQHQLQLRCQQLQQRSAGLRLQLAHDARVLQAPLALADQVRDSWRWLRSHPQWLAAATGVLVLLRPRRALRLARRLWTGWRLWQRLQRWRATLGPLLPPALQGLTARLGAGADSWRSAAGPRR